MTDLVGQPGELRLTLSIKRKSTGKVETYEVVGHSDPEKLKEIVKEQSDGGHAQHGG